MNSQVLYLLSLLSIYKMKNQMHLPHIYNKILLEFVVIGFNHSLPLHTLAKQDMFNQLII